MSAEILAGIEQLKTLTEQYQNQSQEDRGRVTTGLSKIDDLTAGGILTVNIDFELGSDDNDGTQRDRALKTWSAVLEAIEGAGRAHIRLYSPGQADGLRIMTRFPDTVLVEGRNRETNALQEHDLTFVDALQGNLYPGGFHAYGLLNVEFLYASCVMGYSRPQPAIRSFSSTVNIEMGRSPLVKTGNSTAPFVRGERVDFKRFNSVFDPSTAGHIIHGVPAGASPNDYPFIETNFTQG